MNRTPYVLRMFYHTLHVYMRLKNVRLQSLIATCNKLVSFNSRSGKRMSYKTYVLRSLFTYVKRCVYERTLNVRYSIHEFTCV